MNFDLRQGLLATCFEGVYYQSFTIEVDFVGRYPIVLCSKSEVSFSRLVVQLQDNTMGQ